MRPLAIGARDLTKRYRIGGPVRRHESLRAAIAHAASAPVRGVRRMMRSSEAKQVAREGEEFLALRGVSFDIRQGELVGLIGRNGAGKSTLLKILSRITEPTSGRAEVHGRLGSLLEVGTGFHQELSGRDNIFLNGAILGMRRQEIAARFDEIVEFSGVSQFIDTPVKRYSSGMYLRLAFAVAAHLETEILVVDEVLAVGDASFQKKCLAKMEDVGKHGRTVVFVSHNMMAVTRLCERTILLERGLVLADGPSHEVVGSYLRSGLGTTAHREWDDPESAPGNEIARLRGVCVRTEEGEISEAMDIRKPVRIEMTFDVLEGGHSLVPNFHLFNEEGVCVFIVNDQHADSGSRRRPIGRYVSTVLIPGNYLAEGSVVVRAVVSTMDPVTIHFSENDAVAFQVIDSLDGDSVRGAYAGPFPGVVRPLLSWTTVYEPTLAHRDLE
ncbi:MAG TPA: ABC transporter ATP-binding protein, partial [Gemmatimonadaceae bacterium]|nr:ABC transporter ATP-binding protein [Gemmatimonadaceae bacterium]